MHTMQWFAAAWWREYRWVYAWLMKVPAWALLASLFPLPGSPLALSARELCEVAWETTE